MTALFTNVVGLLLLTLAMVAALAWGAFALWFRGPDSLPLAWVLIAAWVLSGSAATATLLSPALHQARLPVVLVFGVLFAAVLGWWLTIQPSQQRDWAPDVARQLSGDIDGDRVTLRNVRNFVWRTREDFTPRWETRRYDLSQLRSVDLIVSYWSGPAIAHTLVSFGFDDGRYLTFSVEVRRTRGMDFSPLGGLFKQTEVVLVAADERDIVRTRSNVRGEDVYLYRVGMPAAAARRLFRAYLGEARALQREPRFYNTLYTNCTTLVFDMVNAIVPGLPKDIRLILSGYLPSYIYDLGALDTSRPLAELRDRGHINARAIASDIDGHASGAFSHAIRRGVPAPGGALIAPEQAPAGDDGAPISDRG